VPLSPEQAEFICSGLSMTAAARDQRLVPSICRVLACQVNPARDQIRLFVVAAQAEALVRDIRLNGELAVVFARPSSHRALQIKGVNTLIEPFDSRDLPQLERSSSAFAEDIAPLGFMRDFWRAFHHHQLDELLTLVLNPVAIFEQTPGPNAGRALEP